MAWGWRRRTVFSEFLARPGSRGNEKLNAYQERLQRFAPFRQEAVTDEMGDQCMCFSCKRLTLYRLVIGSSGGLSFGRSTYRT